MEDENEIDIVVPRSEEDQIRRSVFSRCLRKLATSDDTAKSRWADLIHTIESADKTKRDKRAQQQQGSGRGTKRSREEGEEGVDSAQVVFADEITTIDDLVKLSTSNVGAPDDSSSGGPPPIVIHPPPVEVISSYMRQMLDRVVGLSLNVLSTQSLSFLCIMLELSSKPPKGKDALYALLASFHYQVCEKIGKRVTTNHVLQEQIKRDAAAFAAIAQNAGSNNKKPAVTAPPLAPVGTSKTVKSNKGVVAVQRTEHVPIDISDDVGTAAPSVTRLFQARSTRSNTAVAGASTVLPTSTTPLDQETLCRRLRSLVQVLDPVTLATLLKKLSDSGALVTQSAVEAALGLLAQQGVLYYENGIAYFAG